MNKKIRVMFAVFVLVMTLALGFTTVQADTGDEVSGGESTGAFALLDTYPQDGAKETSVENLGVKLYFNKPMNSDTLGDVNEDKFTLTDAEGNKLPIRVLYAPKEDGVVLVLLDTENLDEDVKVESAADYTLTISADVVDDAGDILGQETKVTFTTQNQTRNGLVNTLLMFVMMGGMMFFTMKGQKAKKDDEDDKKKSSKDSAVVNPYKEAKKTGKSVAEIIEKDKQRKEKLAEKEAKAAEKEAKMLAEYGYVEEDDVIEDYIEENHYRVKAPRTIASAGSTYKTGRKAIYEAKLERQAREAKWAAEAKKKGKKKK